MRLSTHFYLPEFVRSDSAARLGLANDPPTEIVGRLTLLCEKVLEPVRLHFGRPVRINSGYRSPELNRAIGGAAKSQHVEGRAADIEIHGVQNLDLARFIRDNLQFDQLILEAYTPGQPSSGWVHVSYRSGANRQEVMTWQRAYGYRKGLVA